MSSSLTQSTQKPSSRTAAPKSTGQPEHPVDSRLDRIKDKILPQAPYMLTVNQSLNTQHVRQYYPNSHSWMKQYPLFERHEEKLQYLSFLDRSKDSDVAVMHAYGGWDDGKGGMAPQGETFSRRTSSDGTTPLPGQAPKKKISLAEYKNKERNRSATITAKPPVSQPTEHEKNEEKQVGQIEATKETVKVKPHGQKRSVESMSGANDPHTLEQSANLPPAKKSRISPEPNMSHGQKRSVESMSGANDPHTLKQSTDLPPAKKSRVSPEPHMLEQKQKPINAPPVAKTNDDVAQASATSGTSNITQATAAVAKPPNAEPNSQKAKMAEKARANGLPPMLSPLPSYIEDELASWSSGVKARSSNNTSQIPSTVSSSAKQAKKDHLEKSTKGTEVRASAHEKPRPQKVGVATNPHSTNGSLERQKVTSAPRQQVNDARNVTAAKAVPNGVAKTSKDNLILEQKSAHHEGPRTPMLKVILRIKKKHRKRVADYLRMPPTPGRDSLGLGRISELGSRSAASRSETKENKKLSTERVEPPEGKNDLKRKASVISKTDEKPPALGSNAEVPEPPKKRPKIPGTLLQKGHTPKQPSTSSPAISHTGSAQKSHLVAPNMDTKSTPMHRAASGEDLVHTPQHLHVSGTPSTTEPGDRRNSIATSGSNKPKSSDCRLDAEKFAKTATTLKHDADVYFKKYDQMSAEDRKKGTVIGTESVLCYMLAFSLYDSGRQKGDRTSWASIIPYLRQVRNDVRDNVYLSGLLYQLEAVIQDTIVYHDFVLLDRNLPQQDSANGATMELVKNDDQNRAANYHEQRKHFEAAQSAWRNGWKNLDIADIPDHFPKTWAGREERRVAFGRTGDVIQLGKYDRKYLLPLTSMTSGLEAVSFGMSVLEEMCQREHIEWKPKLVL